ncbi:hypothetical protein [Sulfurimonas sp.]|uniref:hypothetical protein n=1 Tax=Sulfurimonas sp. TaxID=2022749 RepID=UPI0026161A40|nr:hypothetical protein [Sulfurimonas sp.]
MKHSFLRKYFSIIFLVATLLGSMHHHNDLKQHNDCKICIIHASMANADTPVDIIYVSQLDIFHEAIIKQLVSFHSTEFINPLNARAPPHFS